MQLPPDSTTDGDSVERTACSRLRRGVPGAAALLAAGSLLGGCGAEVPSSASGGAEFVVGTRSGALPAAPLDAAHFAARFANAYARNAYLSRPPRLTGTTAAVQGALVLAARRVPPGRRRLHPHLLGLTLAPHGARALEGSAQIGDGRSPPFTVGFTVGRVGYRWRVIAISLPG